MRGGVGAGMVMGLVLLLALGWVPVVGALVAGYTIGLHTKSKEDAASAGFVSGAFAAAIFTWLFIATGSQVFVVSEGPLSGLVGLFFDYMYALGPIYIIAQTVILAVVGSVLGTISRKRWGG